MQMPDLSQNGQAGDSSEDIAFKNIDGALDELSELLERWDNRLTIDNLSLAERYLKGELVVGVEFGCVDWGSQQFRAIYQRELPIGGVPVHHGGLYGFPARHRKLHFEPEAAVGGPYRDNQSVFVEDVELVEGPQSAVPSFVRLEPFDEANSLLAGSLYFFKTRGFKTVGAVTDGPISTAGVGHTVGFDDGASEQIKGRADVVNCIADDTPPIIGDIFENLDSINILGCFRIFIAQDAIRVATPKGLDFTFHLMDVFFGPFDLYPDPDQLWGSHGEASQGSRRTNRRRDRAAPRE